MSIQVYEYKEEVFGHPPCRLKELQIDPEEDLYRGVYGPYPFVVLGNSQMESHVDQLVLAAIECGRWVGLSWRDLDYSWGSGFRCWESRQKAEPWWKRHIPAWTGYLSRIPPSYPVGLEKKRYTVEELQLIAAMEFEHGRLDGSTGLRLEDIWGLILGGWVHISEQGFGHVVYPSATLIERLKNRLEEWRAVKLADPSLRRSRGFCTDK